MSETVKYKGKMIEVAEEQDNFRDKIDSVGLELMEFEIEEEYVDESNGYFYDRNSKKLFKFTEFKQLDIEEYIQEFQVNGNEISFNCQFYNGGSCIQEELSEIVEKSGI